MKTNKRKIALCLSGQPRYIIDGYNQIKTHILDKYDVDVFIHTWFDETKTGERFDFSPNNTYGRTGVLEPNTLVLISELYNPLALVYEKKIDFNTYNDVNYEKQRPLSLYSMYYSILKSNELKSKYEVEKQFKYDLVIRCRFDIIFNTFNLDLETINTDLVYVSGEINPYPNDQFAVSNSENMDKYASLFNNIKLYYGKGFKEFVNEKILRYHISEQNLKIYFTNNNELLVNIIKK